MDPNVTLRRLRADCSTIANLDEVGDDDKELSKLAVDVAELFEALDGWITKGGFLPAAWARRATADDLHVYMAISHFAAVGCGNGNHRLDADGQSFPKRCALCARLIDSQGDTLKQL